MPYTSELSVVLLAYALRSFSTGFYLLRLRTGRDIRHLGSGTAGSRNVARTAGLAAAAITLAGDAAKGALAVGAAVLFGLEPWAVPLVMAAVVAGQIWPCNYGSGEARDWQPSWERYWCSTTGWCWSPTWWRSSH